MMDVRQWLRGQGVLEDRDQARVVQIRCMIVNRLSGTPMKMVGDDMVVAKARADGVKRSVGC